MVGKKINLIFNQSLLLVLSGLLLISHTGSCTVDPLLPLASMEIEFKRLLSSAQKLDSLSGDSLYLKKEWMLLDSSLSFSLQNVGDLNETENTVDAFKRMNKKVDAYVTLRLKASENLIQIRLREAEKSLN